MVFPLVSPPALPPAPAPLVRPFELSQSNFQIDQSDLVEKILNRIRSRGRK